MFHFISLLLSKSVMSQFIQDDKYILLSNNVLYLYKNNAVIQELQNILKIEQHTHTFAFSDTKAYQLISNEFTPLEIEFELPSSIQIISESNDYFSVHSNKCTSDPPFQICQRLIYLINKDNKRILKNKSNCLLHASMIFCTNFQNQIQVSPLGQLLEFRPVPLLKEYNVKQMHQTFFGVLFLALHKTQERFSLFLYDQSKDTKQQGMLKLEIEDHFHGVQIKQDHSLLFIHLATRPAPFLGGHLYIMYGPNDFRKIAEYVTHVHYTLQHLFIQYILNPDVYYLGDGTNEKLATLKTTLYGVKKPNNIQISSFHTTKNYEHVSVVLASESVALQSDKLKLFATFNGGDSFKLINKSGQLMTTIGNVICISTINSYLLECTCNNDDFIQINVNLPILGFYSNSEYLVVQFKDTKAYKIIKMSEKFKNCSENDLDVNDSLCVNGRFVNIMSPKINCMLQGIEYGDKCACTVNDLTCIEGYYRSFDDSTKCITNPNKKYLYQPLNCPKDTKYSAPYRQIIRQGDVCEPSNDFIPKTEDLLCLEKENNKNPNILVYQQQGEIANYNWFANELIFMKSNDLYKNEVKLTGAVQYFKILKNLIILTKADLIIMDNSFNTINTVPLPVAPPIFANLVDFHVITGLNEDNKNDDFIFTTTTENSINIQSYIYKDNKFTLIHNNVNKCLPSPFGILCLLTNKSLFRYPETTTIYNDVVNFYILHNIVNLLIYKTEYVIMSTTNGEDFKLSQFPISNRDFISLTFLPTFNNRLFISVKTIEHSGSVGTLFVSDGFGEYYTRSLDYLDVYDGRPQAHEVESLEALIFVVRVVNMANILVNNRKLKQTMISRNNGGKYDLIMGPSDKYMHFYTYHSISNKHIPGLLLVNGNSGDFLNAMQDTDFYISLDYGTTFTKVLDGPYHTAVSNMGGLIVACAMETLINHCFYSLDFMQTIHSEVISEGLVEIKELLVDSDTLSNKLIIRGINNDETVLIKVDFSKLFTTQCSTNKNDFKRIENKCMLGQQIAQYRIIPNNCYFTSIPNFDEYSKCDCTINDYECNFQFEYKNGQCLRINDGQCSVTQRKISISKCKNDLPIPPCKGSFLKLMVDTSKVGDVEVVFTPIPYAARTAIFFNGDVIFISGDDKSGTAYLATKKDGKLDVSQFLSKAGLHLTRHPTNEKILYSFSQEKLFKFTNSVVQKMELPTPPGNLNKISPHPFEDGWLLAQSDCNIDFSGNLDNCKFYYTLNNGDNWSRILEMEQLQKCLWAHSDKLITTPRTAILCQANSNEMFASDDFFKSTISKFQDNIKVFALYGNFIVGGLLEEKQGLVVDISYDGLTWGRAQFSPNYDRTTSLTATDSAGGRLFIDIQKSQDTGNLYVGNFNGSYFTRTLENTYRLNGGVDTCALESMASIHFANIHKDGSNLLETKISYDNGNTWHDINTDVQDCGDKCRLHLYGYTSSPDPRHFMDALKTPGLVIAIGSLGDGIDPFSRNTAQTWMSSDAGRHWKKVFDTPYDFEFLNYGTIIVFFESNKPIYTLSYTDNEFTTPLKELKLNSTSSNKYEISIATSDEAGKGTTLFVSARNLNTTLHEAIIFDFKAYLTKACVFPNDFDAHLIEPVTYKGATTCLFGAKQLVFRKKPGTMCWVENEPKEDNNAYRKGFVVKEPCACTEHDFECDFGFVWKNGKCEITNDAVTYPCDNGVQFIPSGYRKNPGNQCVGGLDMETLQKIQCGGMATGTVIGIAMIPTLIGICGFFLMLHLRRHGELPFGLSDRFRHVRYQNVEGTDNRLFDD